MVIERFHIAAFVGIAALVWWITLVYQGTPVTWEHGRPLYCGRKCACNSLVLI